MKQTTRKHGSAANVINALHSAGAWPVASTSQIYEAARAHGFSYGSAIEVFMITKIGRGKWDVSTVDASGTQTVSVTSTPQVKKAGKTVVTPALKKSAEQAWSEDTVILHDDDEPDTIVINPDRRALIARLAKQHMAERKLTESLETCVNESHDEYERIVDEEFNRVLKSSTFNPSAL
jgi:hypothetical protein